MTLCALGIQEVYESFSSLTRDLWSNVLDGMFHCSLFAYYAKTDFASLLNTQLLSHFSSRFILDMRPETMSIMLFCVVVWYNTLTLFVFSYSSIVHFPFFVFFVQFAWSVLTPTSLNSLPQQPSLMKYPLQTVHLNGKNLSYPPLSNQLSNQSSDGILIL